LSFAGSYFSPKSGSFLSGLGVEDWKRSPKNAEILRLQQKWEFLSWLLPTRRQTSSLDYDQLAYDVSFLILNVDVSRFPHSFDCASWIFTSLEPFHELDYVFFLPFVSKAPPDLLTLNF